MEAKQSKSSNATAKTITLAVWTFLWLLSVALATFGHELFWESNILVNLFFIVLNFGIGIRMIVANINHLRGMDELMQKVHLEAMGISLGLTLVGGISFSLLDITDVIPFDAEIAGLIVFIALTYITSLIINLKRYQ